MQGAAGGVIGAGSAQPAPCPRRGELPRVALAILRESGEPLPIRVIAARALARKDCHAPTRRIFKMTRVRLQQLFGRLDRKGITYSVGRLRGLT